MALAYSVHLILFRNHSDQENHLTTNLGILINCIRQKFTILDSLFNYSSLLLFNKIYYLKATMLSDFGM